jgi:predicted DNA-binding transcriptional regulator AlpA
VAPPIEVRKARFAEWVRRVVDHAKTNRGLGVPQIADMAGIGNQTIYRWINAEGKKLPDPESVVAFCDAIGVGTTEPFQILWPGKTESPPQPQPLPPMDADLQTLMRKLADPTTDEFEKEFIRETLKHLADRPAQRGRTAKRHRPGIAS